MGLRLIAAATAAVLSLLLAATAVECALPREINIAAVFDHDQDRMHELAFRYQLSGSPYC